MGQSIAVITKCSRCPATEHRELTLEEVRELDTLALEDKQHLSIRLNGVVTVEFGTLCAPCRDIVERYIALIGRVSEKKSSLRKSKGDENES